ncbi:MAG: hypothetical protein IJH04_01780, partial [Eggerthellaceae bacterium]|nr:hypothetical protein [Eggerthellaceae bacterium]
MSRISDAIREQERIRLQAVGNELAEEEQERRGMRSEARRVFVLGVLFVVVVFTAMVMPTFMFRHSCVQMTPAVFLDQVADNLSGLVGVF